MHYCSNIMTIMLREGTYEALSDMRDRDDPVAIWVPLPEVRESIPVHRPERMDRIPAPPGPRRPGHSGDGRHGDPSVDPGRFGTWADHAERERAYLWMHVPENGEERMKMGRVILSSLYKPRVVHRRGEGFGGAEAPGIDEMLRRVKATREERDNQREHTARPQGETGDTQTNFDFFRRRGKGAAIEG